MEQLDRGVTYWQAKGAYTGDDVQVLCVCLSKYEIDTLEQVIGTSTQRILRGAGGRPGGRQLQAAFGIIKRSGAAAFFILSSETLATNTQTRISTTPSACQREKVSFSSTTPASTDTTVVTLENRDASVTVRWLLAKVQQAVGHAGGQDAQIHHRQPKIAVLGGLEDEGAGRAAGLEQRHRDEHHHAHQEHDVGHLEGGELLGGAMADAVVHRVAEHGQQQKQQAQGGDHHRAAHGDQRHAAHRAQGTQHLPHRDALVEHQHVHEDAAHGHGGDDRAGHGGGRVEDAVILKDEIGHRLHKAQQHQLAHRLVAQVEAQRASCPGLAHQGR